MRYSLILVAALLIASAVADVKLVTSEFTDKSFTDAQVNGWFVFGNKANRITSQCGDQSLFGGFDAFGAGAYATKSYNSGVDHFELTVSFDLYSIDSWDNEVFSFFVDDQLVYSFQSQFNNPSPRPVNCGSGSWGDRLVAVSFKFPHYRKSFTVKLSSSLNQDAADESWGIKNLQILAKHSGGNISVISDEFNENDFKSVATDWLLVDVPTPAFTQCGAGNKLFGGHNTMGRNSIASKDFKNLPGHYGVLFSFDLWLIDSPDGNDYVQVIADGQIYRFYRPDWVYGDAANFVCGVAGWSERVVRVNLFVPHRGSQINFAIRGVFDEARDNESFGFRNFRVITLGCSSARCKQVSYEFYQNTFGDALDWTDVSGAPLALQKPFSTCSSATLFGPFKVPIQKVYDNLLPHSGVRIFLRVIATGPWSTTTGLQFFVNDVLSTAQVSAEFAKNKICNDDQESIRNYFLDIPHSSSTLDLIIKPINLQDPNKTGFSIRDLSITSYVEEGQTIVSSEFQQVNFDQAVGWTVAGNNQNRVTSKCGKFSIFGGYFTFGKKTSVSKTYSGLAKHDYVVVTFSLYLIDTWDKENFNISIDGQVVRRLTKSDATNGHQALCGVAASLEETYFVQVYVPHTADSVKLTLSDELDELTDNESWGIRDLIIVTGTNLSDGHVSQDTSNCITVYTGCQFEGQSLPVCDDVPDLKSIGWTTPIRSISIPNGKSIKVYKSANYEGDFKQYSESQNCLTGQNFFLINKAFNIDVSNETKLRHHSKKN